MTAAAERNAQEQKNRADREEQRANNAEKRLSLMERFLNQAGMAKDFSNWTVLIEMVDKAVTTLNAWAHRSTSIFNYDEERVIGRGIIAQSQLDGLNPKSEEDRKTAANSIAKKAMLTVSSITKFRWDITVTRIGQLASEMRVSTGNQSIGASYDNADELTKWDGTKKRGLGR
jgi:hypothetical protein